MLTCGYTVSVALPNVPLTIEAELGQLLTEFGPQVTNPVHAWRGDVMDFSFDALASSFRGTVNVTESEVVVDMGLPFLARLLQGSIRSQIEQELRLLFPA